MKIQLFPSGLEKTIPFNSYFTENYKNCIIQEKLYSENSKNYSNFRKYLKIKKKLEMYQFYFIKNV